MEEGARNRGPPRGPSVHHLPNLNNARRRSSRNRPGGQGPSSRHVDVRRKTPSEAERYGPAMSLRQRARNLAFEQWLRATRRADLALYEKYGDLSQIRRLKFL